MGADTADGLYLVLIRKITMNNIIDLIRPLFPTTAKFHTDPKCPSPREIGIDWKLGTDPDRKNKRSKTIILLIDESIIEDYEVGSKEIKRSIEFHIQSNILKKLHDFQPDHNAAYGTPNPKEYWPVI